MRILSGAHSLIGFFIIAMIPGCGPSPIRRPGSWDSARMVGAEPLSQGVRTTRLKDDSASTLFLVEVMSQVKPHYHSKSDETLTILSGKGKLRMGRSTLDVGPGDIVFIPRGTIHSYVNESSHATTAVSIFTPRFQGKDRHFVSP